MNDTMRQAVPRLLYIVSNTSLWLKSKFYKNVSNQIYRPHWIRLTSMYHISTLVCVVRSAAVFIYDLTIYYCLLTTKISYF